MRVRLTSECVLQAAFCPATTFATSVEATLPIATLTAPICTALAISAAATAIYAATASATVAMPATTTLATTGPSSAANVTPIECSRP